MDVAKPLSLQTFEFNQEGGRAILLNKFVIPKELAMRLAELPCSVTEKYNAAVEYYYRDLLSQTDDAALRAKIYAEAYDTMARHFAEWGGCTESGVSPALVEVMSSFFRGKDVIELGCGKGQLAKELSRVFRSYVGVEVSEIFLQKGIEECKGLPNIEFVNQSLTSLKMDESVVDIVYSNDVVEHISPAELEKVLANAFRILRPGGSIVTLTPSRYFGPFDASRVFRAVGETSQGLHLKEYSYQELRDMYARAGFTKIRVLPFALSVGAYISRRWQVDLMSWGISSRFKEVLESSSFLRQKLSRAAGIWTVFMFAEKPR